MISTQPGKARISPTSFLGNTLAPLTRTRGCDVATVTLSTARSCRAVVSVSCVGGLNARRLFAFVPAGKTNSGSV